MLKQLFDEKDQTKILNTINGRINDNIDYRSKKAWETVCREVELSKKGIKFPVQWKLGDRVTWKVVYEWNSKVDLVYLNFIKRQSRAIGNYLKNNEPWFILEASRGTSEDEKAWAEQLINSAFNNQQHDINWGNFYDTQMDDIIDYWLERGIVWCLVYWDKEENTVKFQVEDPLDCFWDVGWSRLTDMEYWMRTFSKRTEALKQEYKQDYFWEEIKWDELKGSNKKSESEVKQCLLVETNDQAFIVRETRSLEEDWMYKIKSTKDKILTKEVFPDMKILPVTPFTPTNSMGDMYPYSWFKDMLELDKQINKMVQKFQNIVNTWGRYVYVRQWTVLSKRTDNLMNRLGVEVIEVQKNQELPTQATLLQISQQDLQFLDFCINQIEQEGWMRQEIMWGNTLGDQASWIAIQSIQAGSKNNIGVVLTELNKFMARLINIVLNMYITYWSADWIIKIYSSKLKIDMEVDPTKLKDIRVKVNINARNAFDEVTERLERKDLLNTIKEFNPDTPISTEIICDIYGLGSDIAQRIEADIDSNTNPDTQIATWENRKMMQWVPLNVNELDDHILHIALHQALLQNIPPEDPKAKIIMDHLNQHDAFWQAMMQQGQST